MEYVNLLEIRKQKEAVNLAMQSMSNLCEVTKKDGLQVSAKELYLIASSRLSLTKVYQSEALHRAQGSPQYVIEEATDSATRQANKHQSIVDKCREFAVILGRLPENNFVLTSEGEVKYNGNLEKELTALHTKQLSKKEETLANGITTFQKALKEFNLLITEAGELTK